MSDDLTQKQLLKVIAAQLEATNLILLRLCDHRESVQQDAQQRFYSYLKELDEGIR